MGDNPFWSFSVSVYSRPRVAELCLRLQNEYDLDVNLVLFACFLASRGRVLDLATTQYLDGGVSRWRMCVIFRVRRLRLRQKQLMLRTAYESPSVADATRKPLNDLVAAVSRSGERLYQDLKGVELQSERLEQNWLWSFTQRHEADFTLRTDETPGLALLHGVSTDSRHEATDLLQALWNIVSSEMSDPPSTGGEVPV